MLEYLNLYMKLDTYLLADIFLKFRNFLHQQLEIDPAHFISLPSFSFSCMLKMTKVEIEAIRDIEVYNFLNDNIRGGFSFIHQRRADNVEKSEHPISRLFYIDANNLYGWAQTQRLPVKNFEFIKEEVSVEKLKTMLAAYDLHSEESETEGFIAEVDLEYPESLHENHRSFPLAPVKQKILFSQLSKYQKRCHETLGTTQKNTEKLIGTFYDREKYVVHASCLKLYTSLGMKIKKVHRILTFTESTFLKPYILFCTSMRKAAKNDFEKNMFKLLCNSNFGKFIENIQKYIDMKFARNREEFLKLSSNPRFSNYMIISDHLVAVFMKRKSITCRQAYGIGFSILEISKYFMYNSYYTKIKPALGDLTKVLFSDTDSLFLATNHCEPYLLIKDIMDFSNFPIDHPLYSKQHKSELGYFKSETGSEKIEKFIGLRAKCYSFLTEKMSQEIKCKGLSKSYRSNIGIDLFERCLHEITSVSKFQRTLGAKSHEIRIAKQKKLVFSSSDDKFFILPCGLHTLPYNSKEIPENLEKCSFCLRDYCIAKKK